MKNRRLTAILLLVIFAAGALLVWWMAAQADREMRAELLRQTRLVAQPVNVQRVMSLLGAEADMDSPGYRRVKEQLAAVRLANSQYRFIYIMGRKSDGSVFFFADSEPAGAKDYSPPGQVYEEIPEGYRHVFDSKSAVVEGPVTDRWGVWVSALVPLTDPKTGAVVAVLGMDIDAHDWKWDVAVRAALPVGLMFLLLIGIASAVASARRVDASPKPVLRRMLPSLAAMVILLIVGAWVLLWQQHQQQLAGEIAANISEVSGDMRTVMDQQAFGLSMAVQPIATNTTVQKALRDGDVDRLLADWQPVFETLHWQNKLTHFYFFDANRICLLRVHKPENSGDLIDRFTALEAERTGKIAYGIELGPLSTFTLRVVQPVFEGGRLVGYVELGKEIEDILQTLDTQSGNQLAVVIRKEHLNRKTWEDGMRMLGRLPDWDRLHHNVVIYASNGHLPDVFAPWADQTADKQANSETSQEIAFDGKDWRISATPLQDVSGKGVGDLLIMRDITTVKVAFARLMVLGGTGAAMLLALLLGFIYVLLHRTDAGIRAQQATLRESEESYRSQFANNSAVMLLIDPEDGAIIDANAAAMRFYDYPRELLLTMCITDINTLPASKVMQAMASVPHEQGKRFQFQHRMADGSLRDVEVSASSIQFGGRVVLHSIINDITGHKQAEEALIRSEEKFRKAFYTSPDSVSISRLEDGTCISINPGFTKITGYTEEDIIGKTSMEFNIWVNIEDRQKLVAGLRKDGEVTNLEATFRTKGGDILHGLLSSSVIALGGVPHILGIARDITKRKRTEEERAKLEAQLRQAQKMESIGSLAGGIAHDLNNILFPISGLSEMLLDDIPSDTPAHKSIEQIHKSAQRGSDLVKQILSFSRQSNPQKLPIRIQPILQEVLKLARATIPWNIEITSNIKQDCGMVSANPTQVHQIAMNLITNAFHAVERNGGTINVELKETIIMHLDEGDESPLDEMSQDGTSGFPIRLLAGGYACITLSDTGTGIDQTLIDKIFDPYFTTKELGKGTGLGLSVVHGIVKEHGGDIRVHSEVGKGTAFNVYLPLLKEVGNRKDTAVIEKYPTGCERILIVDDEEQIVLLEQMMLEKLGYKTTARTSSPDALAAFRANPSKFDLVICDRGMPNMTGEQLARELILIKPEIPIIICTGFCDETDMQCAMATGIKGFLAKPVSAGDLAKMVRKVLDGRGLLSAIASLRSGIE